MHLEASMSTSERSTVLTLRVPADLDRRIEQAARRKRRTKSALLREALHHTFGKGPLPDDPAREARRQSLLVSGRQSERDALDFVEHATDDRGWR
jgi:predicted transcriptional regulator